MSNQYEDGRITQGKLASVVKLIQKDMVVDEQYSWELFWTMFIIPSDLEVHKHTIHYNNTGDRARIKDGVNKIFAREKIAKRLFVEPTKGVVLLDEDTEVAVELFLRGVKKWKQTNDNQVDKCAELSEAPDLSEDDQRLLRNTSRVFDTNKSTLIGTIERMRSISPLVKRNAIALLKTGERYDEDEL